MRKNLLLIFAFLALVFGAGAQATIILEAHDVWQDGSGYQMLLDADHNTFGTIIPTTGPLTPSGDVPDSIYAQFEYKIPAGADGSLSTTNIVFDGSVTITIPAGTYDFCITNPTPGDRMWIAGDNIDVTRADDYVFEDNTIYHFTMMRSGSGDGASLETTFIPTGPTVIGQPANMFINAMVGASGTASANVLAFNLTSGITATTAAPFAVSADGLSYSSTATLPSTGGPLYVEYTATAQGLEYGDIILSSTGADNDTIHLTGKGLMAAALPYSCNFEDTIENINWEIVNSDANKWFIGTGANNTAEGQYALYISNDNGVTNSYDISAPSTAWAYRDIDFGQYAEYQMAFDFRGYGESTNYDYMKIFIGTPADVPADNGTPNGATLLGTLVNVPEWTHYTATLPASFSGLRRVYLMWWNDGSVGTQPPAAIDNITVVGSNCVRPTALASSNITAHTADITFQAALPSDMSWEYALCTGTQTPDSVTPVSLNDTAFQLTDLDAGTTYYLYVRTDCGSGEYSVWSTGIAFATPPTCTSPQNLTVSSIAGTSALVTWGNAPVGATGYTFAYSVTGMDDWTTIEPTENQILLAGLDPLTTYEVSVSSVCDEGSAPAATQSFTTRCLMGGEFQLGDGTNTTGYFPNYNLYNYSYTQQIFLASEMNGASNIYSIAFNAQTINDDSRHIAIYLMNTTENSGSAWLNAANAQMVYNGTQTLTEGWNTFSFSNPFAYNGTDNLAVIVIDSTGTWTSSNSWMIHTASSELSRYTYQDSAPYGISSAPSSGYSSSYRNNVIFGMPCDSSDNACVAPNLFVDSIATDAVTIFWAPGYMETEWELQYKMDSDTEWTSAGTVTASPATIENLLPNTLYNIRLGTSCDTNYQWAQLSVRTECAAFAIPFMENFDSYGVSTRPNCWTFPITYSDAPYVTAGSNSSAPNSLFFQSLTTTPTTAVTPALDADIQTLRVKFALRAESTSSSGTFEVGVMSDPNNVNTFESVIIIQPTNTSWNNYVVDLDSVTMTGTGRHIAFRQNSNASNYYYWLDNIVVKPIPACEEPTGLSASNVTTTSVDLAWNSLDNDFNLYYRNISDTAWTVENNVSLTNGIYSLSGLSHSTTYLWTVGNLCSDGSETMSDEISSFSTTMMPADLPYTTDFNAGSDMTWIFDNGTCTNVWTIGTVDTASAMFVTTDGTTPGYSISSTSVVLAKKLFTVGTTPEFTISFDVQSGGEGGYDYLKAFLAPADNMMQSSTSTPAYAENSYATNAVDFSNYLANTGSSSYPYKLNLTNGILHVEVNMPNPNANPDANSTAELIFLWRNDGSVGTQPAAILYNVSLTAITCPKPVNLAVSNVSNSTADITWTPTGSESAWVVEYKESTATSWTEIPVTATTHTLTGLNTLTSYDVRVKADCSDETSQYVTTSFNTLGCAPSDACTYTLVLGDGYGDGWNGAYLTIEQNGITVATVEAVDHELEETPTSDNVTVSLCDGISTSLVWHNGGFDDEISITLLAPNGTQLFTVSDLETNYSSPLYTFTTDCNGTAPTPCETPTGLHTTNIQNETVTIAWNANSNVNSWNIQYRVAGTSTWSTASTSSNSYTITGLTGLTEYEIQVQADCGSGNTSDWCDAITAHTTNVGIENRLENSVALFPNPAKEYVDIRIDGDLNVTMMEVYDVYGKLVTTADVMNRVPTMRINVSGLADGMYFVRVTTEQGAVTKSFVKR